MVPALLEQNRVLQGLATRMRLFPLLASLLVLFACTTQQAVAPVPLDAMPAEPYGISIEEEAAVLGLEDRREFDRSAAEAWLSNPNPLHRARMALALGRIGPSTFLDANGNGEKDAGERAAGVDLLIALVSDPDFHVRRTAAFALGEIGDPLALEALFILSGDPEHADVGAEAVEALSKMASTVPLERYVTLTGTDIREGIRARAVRYLFRFGTDEATAVAAALLDDSNANVKREAAYTLARRAYAAARPTLELLLNDGDTLTRAYAARGLGLIAAPDSVAPLIRAMGDVHPWVRINAARAMVQLAEKHPSAIVTPEVAEQVIRVIVLSNDPDPGARIAGIETLGYYADHNQAARQRLLELAAGGSTWAREVATGAVARHLGDDRDSPLSSLVATDARWVKVRALEQSGLLGGVGQRLRERFFRDSDPSVRATAMGSVPDPSVDQELALIKKGLEDPDPVVRANAVERYALSRADPLWQRLELLRQAEERGRGDVLNDARLAAISAIGKTEHPEREAFLRGLLRDQDPVARRTAAEIIVQELKRPAPQYTPLAVERPMSDYLEIARWARQPHTATIHTSRGKIELALLAQEAPMTAKNFADLAARGFYNGTSFMRVVPNFVIQGGDPRNDMSGGPGYAIRDEINMQKYTRGAVGMALSGPDTGGSQFFITHSAQPHLDGGYTIFGRVIGGMTGVVDQTERGNMIEKITIDENRPSTPPDTIGMAAIERTPLPIEIGPMEPGRMVAALPEYAKRKSEYQPDRDAVQMISAAVQPGDHIEVYLGTWCPDSQREVPKFLKVLDLLEQEHGVNLPARYIALNRAKKEPAELIAGKNIEKVATFIYYRGDQELGRIVERPNGMLEDDLLQIVAR